MITLLDTTGPANWRPSLDRVQAPLAAAMLIGIALLGLTDAMPDATAQPPKAGAAAGKNQADANTYTVTGRCLDDVDNSPLAGVTVRLFRIEGRTSPPEEIATTLTDAEGRYSFPGVVPPRRENHLDRLAYGVLGFAEGRPIGDSFFHYRGDEEVVEIRMVHESSTLTGRVIDARGRPVAGATVFQYFIYDRPAPALHSATTDVDGRFRLDEVPVYRWPNGTARGAGFSVLHPDHPRTSGQASTLPEDVVVTLPDGCVVRGTVIDSISGQPAAGAVVTARHADDASESFAETNAEGTFRLLLPEGRYDFLADAKDRVCVAATGEECRAGERVELPPLTLIGGGFISGQVVNTATGELVSQAAAGQPVMLGLIGPSQPAGRAVSPARLAAVDQNGRFTMRAVPGENFPYFVNIRGARMSWDTREQPPVVVKEGETTTYNMLITPPIPPEEKLLAAGKVVASLSDLPLDRTAEIIFEFRKLSHTVDETELWCSLMRELVALRADAVPQLCAELDQTTDDRTLRRLAFALRAIGDPRAVPALIRAIPKTLLPSSSDYGLIVADKELTGFMQQHDLKPANGGANFDLGRPVREIFGTLHDLTGHDFNDGELFNIHLSEDPRRQIMQRRLYQRQAERWQAWWQANWRRLTDNPVYKHVRLETRDESLPAAPETLGETAKLSGETSGAVLSPPTEERQYTCHAYDLDTGYRPKWPAELARDEAARDDQQQADWASQTGVDLICTTHRAADGTETYALRALGMKVWEIDAREVRDLDKLLAAGKLPEGRPVDELLMHYDAKSDQLVPDANAAFLFVTREGSMGLIETTDRVTRTANLGGAPYSRKPGVGFHKGVRFDLKAIIP